MLKLTSKLIINGVEYELKDALARNEISVLDNELDIEKNKIIDLENSEWELKVTYTSATETLNLTVGKVE